MSIGLCCVLYGGRHQQSNAAEIIQRGLRLGRRRYYARLLRSRKQTVWLNADVLPGPGLPTCAFDADDFVRTCRRLDGAIPSLGWRCDVGLAGAYSDEDADAMLALVRKHGLAPRRAGPDTPAKKRRRRADGPRTRRGDAAAAARMFRATTDRLMLDGTVQDRARSARRPTGGRRRRRAPRSSSRRT